MQVIIKLMLKNHIDILIRMHTRADRDISQYLSAQARELLGQGCFVVSQSVEPKVPLKRSQVK